MPKFALKTLQKELEEAKPFKRAISVMVLSVEESIFIAFITLCLLRYAVKVSPVFSLNNRLKYDELR